MAYLRTVLTYHQPSEAEVDKAFLESNGLTVCLLNANTSRNELGAPFYIQLQVADDEYQGAVALLREANPQRFGSAERVAEIEKGLIRGVVRFAVPAVVFGVAGFFFAPAPLEPIPGSDYAGAPTDMRVPIAISAGGLAGIISVFLMKKTEGKGA